ncbi:MAG: hypothetical protein HY925_10065 [Elusimicrobia bacterium]|nr:hypothetical protein [Elusimicrobiota bacterium]
MPIAALTFAAALALPSAADTGAVALPEAQLFLRPLAQSSSRVLALRRVRAAADDAARRVDRWLGLVAEAQGGTSMTPAAVLAEVADGLAARRYKSLILGESHSVPEEKAFAKELLDLLLARGLKPASFIREQYTYDDASALTAAGVPVLDFRNQFQPEPEIDAALKKYRGLPATYSGHAHSCDRVKDYVQNVLLAGLPFGYGPGKKDMPTIEDSFEARGLKPAIVSMVEEEGMLSRIERMFLKDATAATPDLASLRQGLKEASDAFKARMAALPGPAKGIHFFRHPKQANLVLGITRDERRPLAIDSALEALSDPSVEAWLAGAPVESLESLRHSWGEADGSVRTGYTVILHKSDDRLEREIPVR